MNVDQEQYFNWLAGADHALTEADLKEIKSVIYSKDADDIFSTSSTVLGATP